MRHALAAPVWHIVHLVRAAWRGATGRGDSRAARPRAVHATQVHPLLVLHRGHVLRCWPTDDAPWTAVGQPAFHRNWIVEIDGLRQLAGPAAAESCSPREMSARVAQWWDDAVVAGDVSRAWHRP